MSFNFGLSDGLMVFAVLAAIAAMVLAFIFLVPEKCRAKLNGFGKFIHDTLNFKYLIISKVLQAFTSSLLPLSSSAASSCSSRPISSADGWAATACS